MQLNIGTTCSIMKTITKESSTKIYTLLLITALQHCIKTNKRYSYHLFYRLTTEKNCFNFFLLDAYLTFDFSITTTAKFSTITNVFPTSPQLTCTTDIRFAIHIDTLSIRYHIVPCSITCFVNLVKLGCALLRAPGGAPRLRSSSFLSPYKYKRTYEILVVRLCM